MQNNIADTFVFWFCYFWRVTGGLELSWLAVADFFFWKIIAALPSLCFNETAFYKIAKAVGMDVNRTLTLEHWAFMSSDFTVRQKGVTFY